MVLHCAIHLPREPPIYSPGDIIEGVLVLSSTWADKIHGISVKLVKKLEVEWDTYRLYEKSRVSSVEDVAFLSECEIVLINASGSSSSSPSTSPSSSTSSAANNAACVVPTSGSSIVCSTTGPLATFTSKRGVVVTRGVQHRYPFLLKVSYELDLPASFSGTYGYIAYKLIAFIKTPKKTTFIGGLKDVCIYPILDLNHLDLSLQQPIDEKRVFKSLFGYNYVFMKCHLDKRALLPEEVVSFTVEITNKSPATLDGVEVNLNMATQFSILGASKVENLTLLRIRGPCIGQGEHAIWSHSFTFPACTFPTGFGQLSILHSKSIDLQYTLLFTLEVSKAEKFAIPFRLVIGTVPYGHNKTRVVCMDHHNLESSLERMGLGAAAEPVPCSSRSMSSSGDESDRGRVSGASANVTPSSTATTSGHFRLAKNSSEDCGYGSSSSRRATPDPAMSSVSGCSGGFCCTVRGHQPRCRPRSKSTSALPPSYSATNLHYQCIMLRRAETPPPTYYEAKKMMCGQSNAATP